MIVFLSGYPAAGKSHVVREIVEKLPFETTVIDPKTFRPDDYDKLDEAAKRDLNVSVWEVSLDVLSEQIKGTSDSTIIFYDTACANLQKMRPLFELAAAQGHHVVYLFVVSTLEKCKERIGDKWLAEDVIDRYTKNFKENINVFKALASKTLIVRNEADVVPDVQPVVDYIKNYYG